MNWKLWGRGLVAALVGGAVSAISVMSVDPADFNFTTGAAKVGQVALVGALMNAAAYLKTHPTPWDDINGGR